MVVDDQDPVGHGARIVAKRRIPGNTANHTLCAGYDPAVASSVQAAGGLVHRPRGDGSPELVLVHRPRYGDWTLPKGKLEPGETHEEAALREVEEETGLRCELGRELASTAYRDGSGRPKTVRYWAMRPLAGSFRPHEEVDAVCWVSLPEAEGLLTHGRDREVLRAFAEAGG
jgi:8-oxo-dGTP diphosphatase